MLHAGFLQLLRTGFSLGGFSRRGLRAPGSNGSALNWAGLDRGRKEDESPSFAAASWRTSPLTPPQSCQNLHRTGNRLLGSNRNLCSPGPIHLSPKPTLHSLYQSLVQSPAEGRGDLLPAQVPLLPAMRSHSLDTSVCQTLFNTVTNIASYHSQ